jgi:energy-converting hydrogenase A subunit R
VRSIKFICFDLEGPLSPEDNAYELMRLFPRGGEVFEVISRYDDLLTLEGREGYEPGDTLSLIVPFLVCHSISQANIELLAQKAGLTPGARELVSLLHSRDWEIFCISTSYQQYARQITQRLGIAAEDVACTTFPLDHYSSTLCQEDVHRVKRAEEEILALAGDDQGIKKALDRFFWEELPSTKLGIVMREVKPVGGRRKVEALKHFAEVYSQPLSRWAVVGDSITDFRMLETVDQAGGLAIAFNANEYALPYATMGLASTDLHDLWTILQIWEESDRTAVERVVREKERGGGAGDREHFHWLAGGHDLSPTLEIHQRIRRLVRQEASKLG